MTAVRATDSDAPGVAKPNQARQRRAGAAHRTTSAAGQARRSLQRDLAAREASLRISRRVSGPAGGIARPMPVAPPQAQPPTAFPQQVPVARPTAPTAAPQRAPQRVARAAQPQSAPRQAPATQRGVDLRRQPQQQQQPSARAPFGVAPATAGAAAAAAAPMAQPAARPVQAPARPFIVLPGGAPDAAPGSRRRAGTPAVVISALVAIVFTIGLVVAAQIRVTQMNEQIGSDLAATSRLEQATIAEKEKISSLVTSARIEHEAARQQLIEPDPVDVTYLSTGDRAQIAERAARMLRDRPLNPVGGAAATSGTGTASATTVTSQTPSTTTTAAATTTP